MPSPHDHQDRPDSHSAADLPQGRVGGKKPVPMAFSAKLLYSVLALACVIIGLLGLVLPVIPGVLFLAAALFLVTKVSRRVKRWSDASPLLEGMNKRLASMEDASVKDRAKVVGLATLAVMAQTLEQVLRLGRWLTRKLVGRRRTP